MLVPECNGPNMRRLAALIFLLSTASCAKQGVRESEVAYDKGFSPQYLSNLSRQIGTASGKADEFVADGVVARVLDQVNWSGEGAIVKWSSDTKRKWWLSDGGASSRLFVYFPHGKIAGEWRVGGEPGNVAVILVAGRYEADRNPMCIGIASSGQVVVGAKGKRSVVSVDASFKMASVGFGRKDCRSHVDLKKDIEVR